MSLRGRIPKEGPFPPLGKIFWGHHVFQPGLTFAFQLPESPGLPCIFGVRFIAYARTTGPETELTLPGFPWKTRLWPIPARRHRLAAARQRSSAYPPHRNPILLFRFADSFLLRFETRTFSGLLFQDPPRSITAVFRCLQCKLNRPATGAARFWGSLAAHSSPFSQGVRSDVE